MEEQIPLEGDIVPLEDCEESVQPITTSTLVGKVICEKPLNKGAVKNILTKVWGNPTTLSIVDLAENCFMFNFLDDELPKRIIEDSPWYVMGHLLSLQWWCPWTSISEVSYNLVPFWVQIHGIPLEALTVKATKKIGQRLGGLMDAEEPMHEGKLLRSCLRMRITIDITQPLTIGFWVPMKEKGNVWVLVKYEKLQDYCYTCGIIGHDQKMCRKEKNGFFV